MRAAVITEPGGPSVFQVQEIEDPVAGLDDVLVDVKATALNRADLIQRQGAVPRATGNSGRCAGPGIFRGGN